MDRLILFFAFAFLLSSSLHEAAMCGGDNITWDTFLDHTYIIHAVADRESPRFTAPSDAFWYGTEVDPYEKPYNPWVHTTFGYLVYPHQFGWDCSLVAYLVKASALKGRIAFGNEQDIHVTNIDGKDKKDVKTTVILPADSSLAKFDSVCAQRQVSEVEKALKGKDITKVTYLAYETCKEVAGDLTKYAVGTSYVAKDDTAGRETLRAAIDRIVTADANYWPIVKCEDDTTDYTATRRFNYGIWPRAPFDGKFCIEKVKDGAQTKCIAKVSLPPYYNPDLQTHGKSIWGPIHNLMKDTDEKTLCTGRDIGNYTHRAYRWAKKINTWIASSKADWKNLNDETYAYLERYRDRLLEFGFLCDFFCALRKYVSVAENKCRDRPNDKTDFWDIADYLGADDMDTTIGDHWGSVNFGFAKWTKDPPDAADYTDPFDPHDMKKVKYMKKNKKRYAAALEYLASVRCQANPIPSRRTDVAKRLKEEKAKRVQEELVPNILSLPVVGDHDEPLSQQPSSSQSQPSQEVPKTQFSQLRNRMARKQKKIEVDEDDLLIPL